ncbi:iron chaperone [Clostridium saccharoperbutylacetonicum]
MKENKTTYQSIDEYILQFSPDIQDILKMLRKVIKEAAPDAEEKISWGMPAFAYHGSLVYFAAHKNHIGFYPAPSGIEAFKQELSEYKAAKGSVQFPITKPLPYELISKIVRFRVAENTKNKKDKLKSNK